MNALLTWRGTDRNGNPTGGHTDTLTARALAEGMFRHRYRWLSVVSGGVEVAGIRVGSPGWWVAPVPAVTVPQVVACDAGAFVPALEDDDEWERKAAAIDRALDLAYGDEPW